MALKPSVVGLAVVSIASAHMGPSGSQRPEHKMPYGNAVSTLLTASSTGSASHVEPFVNATTGANIDRSQSLFWSTNRGLTANLQ